MRITPFSTSTNTVSSPLSDDNAIKLLEKQKMQLQEQIQKTNESKLDAKAKQDRIKQLQDQIQQIDMEIQQKRTEKINQNQNVNRSEANNQANTANIANNEADRSTADMSGLVKASATYSQAKVMESTKNAMNGKGRVLKIEIELDEKRGGVAKAKRAELQETKSKIQDIDEKMGETMQASQNQVKETQKKEHENKNEADSAEETDIQAQAVKENEKVFKRIDIKI